MSNEQRRKNIFSRLLAIKGGLFLEIFSFSSKLTKKVPNNYLEHYPLLKKGAKKSDSTPLLGCKS